MTDVLDEDIAFFETLKDSPQPAIQQPTLNITQPDEVKAPIIDLVTAYQQQTDEQKGLGTAVNARTTMQGTFYSKPPETVQETVDKTAPAVEQQVKYIGEIKPYWLPTLLQEDSTVGTNLKNNVPIISITQFKMSSMLQTVLTLFKNIYNSISNGVKNFEFSKLSKILESDITVDTVTDTIDAISKSLGINKAIENAPGIIPLLFATFAGDALVSYKLPLMSQVNLSTTTSSGWKPAQSMYSAINKIITGLSPTAGDIASTVTTALPYIGIDIPVGPLWSTSEVFTHNSNFSFTTYLINDTNRAATVNQQVIDYLCTRSLPDMESVKFDPGALFNIELSWVNPVITSNIAKLKRLFCCTADITITPVGIFREGIPEVYQLGITFKSLLPDILTLQLNESLNDPATVNNLMKSLIQPVPLPEPKSEAEGTIPGAGVATSVVAQDTYNSNENIGAVVGVTRGEPGSTINRRTGLPTDPIFGGG